MPGKEPLIETLKVCILNLQTEGPVTDSSPHLTSCCELLELILRKGLQQPVLSLKHRDYWCCFEQLLYHDTCGSLGAISLAVQTTTTCPKLLHAQGRGRYFIRLMLNRRTLGNVVKHMLHTNRLMEWYTPDVSILRNEELLEPFLSLCMVLSDMEFKLNTENCSFLDESWLLPVCDTYEVVPCRELGIVLRYLDRRVFVVELLPGGQAQADMFAEPGDVIDEINGTSLRNSSNGQASVVLSRLKGKPLFLRLLRWRTQDGTVYRPLVPLLRKIKEENPSLEFGMARPKVSGRSSSQLIKEGRILYGVQLMGRTNIGLYGGKEALQFAIPVILQQSQSRKEVLLDVKETHLICMDKSTKQMLFQHHFPEISCVGRFGQLDHTIFAFCVVDTACMGFCCVVLQATSSSECEEIIHRIAAGFKNTEWFV